MVVLLIFRSTRVTMVCIWVLVGRHPIAHRGRFSLRSAPSALPTQARESARKEPDRTRGVVPFVGLWRFISCMAALYKNDVRVNYEVISDLLSVV